MALEALERICSVSLVPEGGPSQHSVILGVIESQSAEVVDVTEEINGSMDHPHLEEDGKGDIYDDFLFRMTSLAGSWTTSLPWKPGSLRWTSSESCSFTPKYPEGMRKQLDAK